MFAPDRYANLHNLKQKTTSSAKKYGKNSNVLKLSGKQKTIKKSPNSHTTIIHISQPIGHKLEVCAIDLPFKMRR